MSSRKYSLGDFGETEEKGLLSSQKLKDNEISKFYLFIDMKLNYFLCN